jgi:NADH-quinone oxidoreductase subunit N
VILGLAHDQVDDARASAFYGALLLIHAGAMIVSAANELVLLFVALELVSIPTYLLLYLPRRNATTLEAATKYFYLSVFSSALLLFGLAYLYGLTGTSQIKAAAALLHDGASPWNRPVAGLSIIAIVFLLAGLGFRVAAVPFHFYAPDVYEGSPTVLAGVLAWLPKAVGFIAILRIVTTMFGGGVAGPFDAPAVLVSLSEKGAIVAWVIAVSTMVLGNTMALVQTNLRRLLAYSSIAHAGYLMMGVAAAFKNGSGGSSAILGADSILFYLVTYALMTLGVFGGLVALSSPARSVETIDDLAGLARSRPGWALGLAICLFSLAGIPPFAGFWGKFQIFSAVLAEARGRDQSLFLSLAVLGGVNAAVGAYYYLRIIVRMYLGEDTVRQAAKPGWPTVLAAGVCMAGSAIVGLAPGVVSPICQSAARSIVTLPTIEPPRTAILEQVAR